MKIKQIIKNVAAGLLVGSLMGAPAFALPEGPQVVHGQANVNAAGQTMTINQASQQAIINWNGFSISSGELVRFLQPGQLATILNRVTGAEASVINGILEGNGQIYLINPNGVLIGPGATVNAGSFLASTLNVTDDDFLAGNMNFTQATGQDLSAVVNQGRIEVADGGFVMLIAPSIANEGLILARGGEVKLGAGTQATVNFDGQQLVNFATSQPQDGTLLLSQAQSQGILAQVVSSTGVEEAGSLFNSGEIEAGSVLYQAHNQLVLPGVTRTADITGTTTGDAILGSQSALDGHSINITAGGDIVFDTLLAERIATGEMGIGGTVTLTAGGSIVRDPNHNGAGIGANVVNLTANGGSISTPVFADSVSATAPNGSISMSMAPGTIEGTSIVGANGTTVNAKAGGNVDINSVNTVYVGQVSGNNVSITSQTGSVVDAGDTPGADNLDIISSGDTSLSAGEFLGTVDNPLEVSVQGNLNVLAQRDIDGVSGVINGFVGNQFIQNSLTAGNVILNFTNAGQSGLKQAQAGLLDNANTAPGDEEPGGASIPSLFFTNLTVATDEDQWMNLLRGTVVWEDSDEESDEL